MFSESVRNGNGRIKSLKDTISAATVGVNWWAVGIGAAITAISLISKGIEAYKQKLKEAAQEASNQAEESAKAVSSLLDLKNQLAEGTKSSDELTSAFKEQLKAMGYTEKQIDALINKYGGLSGAMDEATKKALEKARTDAHTDVATSSKMLTDVSAGGLTTDIIIEDINTGNQDLDSQIESILSEVATTTGSSPVWVTKDGSAEGLYSYYTALQEIVKLIQETASETKDSTLLDLGNFFNTTTYGDVTEAIGKLSEAADLYGDAIGRLHSADAQLELADYLKTNSINSKESFDNYIKGIQNSKEYSAEYKLVLIDVANNAFPQFSNAAKDTGENVNKMTVSLESLAKASEGISTLQKAFKELSDDGYITTDTLLKIKEATGLADDEWSAYEQRLLNAKAGSDEFNKALSDLTYEVLEAKLQTGELTDAEKTYVENLLKGNGVVNATEIASAAIEKLVAWEDIFNNSRLDVSDKIKKLDEMAKAIGKPIAEMVVLNSLLSGSMGGSFNDDGSYTYKVKSSKPQDYADKEVTLSPSDIQNMIRDAYDAIWEETKPIAEYSPNSSSKNEALDKALKQAERLYKVHQNELDYIKDLESASANYAKTEEERLEIQDKIDEARKDYAHNQISDIEHQIELLQNVEGEEANVLEYYKRIQDIVHTEAKRLRGLGYDDNSSEIQELQNQWWDAQNSIIDWRTERLKENIEKAHDIFADKSNFEIDKNDSSITILDKYYETINSIKEAQRDITKELNASLKMYEYLDEESKKLLFNEEDYVELREKLNDSLIKTDELYREYNDALENATVETIEEITNHYERQLELKMKEYEILSNELEVEKKRMQLNNTLAEKNVRMYINGEWTYVANTQDVIKAQEELVEAEYELEKSKSDKRQEERRNELKAENDRIKTQQNIAESIMEDLIEILDGGNGSIKDILDSIDKDLMPDLFDSVDNMSVALTQFVGSLTYFAKRIESGDLTKDSGRTGTLSISPKTIDKSYGDSSNNNVYLAENGSIPLGLSVGTRIVGDDGTWAITEIRPDGGYKTVLIDEKQTIDKYKKSSIPAYAKGTSSAKGGLSLVNDGGGVELLHTKYGDLVELSPGDKIFSNDQVSRLYEMSKAGAFPYITPAYRDIIKNIESPASYLGNRYSGALSNNYAINGDVILQNVSNPNEFVSELTKMFKNRQYK